MRARTSQAIYHGTTPETMSSGLKEKRNKTPPRTTAARAFDETLRFSAMLCQRSIHAFPQIFTHSSLSSFRVWRPTVDHVKFFLGIHEAAGEDEVRAVSATA